jgi:O-antigen ligase
MSVTSPGIRGPLARYNHSRPAIPSTGGLHTAIVVFAVGFIALVAMASFYDLRLLPPVLALGALLCVAVPVVRWPVATSAAWILIAGSSPEMWLGEMAGDPNTITAIVKLSGLGLVVACILRYGGRPNILNPASAYILIFIVGLLHGMWPTLTVMDSARSLIGSAAPFAFSFSRLSRRWCRAVIEATIWVPSVCVAFGVILAAAGIRPVFSTNLGGLRLEGSTHPAFLGGFCATAIYACLIELYRSGQKRYVTLIVLNFAILLASGARAPLAVALLVTGVAFFFVRSGFFPARRRLGLIIGGLLLLPIGLALASGSTSIRLLEQLSSKGADLSGRNLIWPLFESAWNASPWFGWGIGAGKDVINPNSLLAKLLGTTAAHNEYLRMGVEGGYFGLVLLVLSMAVWVVRGTRHARMTDRVIMRVIIVAFALHSFTDNTLISATASIMFAWMSAVFARAELEAEAASDSVRRRTSAAAVGMA